MYYSFWQYELKADIHAGSLEQVSNDSGVIEHGIFSDFGGYIFGTFRDKAKIIVRKYVFPRGFPLFPKYVTLNDPEWPSPDRR